MTVPAAISLEQPVLAVACVDGEQAFAALRPEWNALLRSSDADNPFLTWEWLHAWWMHVRDTSDLCLLTVRRDGHLVALAPLRRRAGVAWLSRFEFLGTGHAGSDYLDVIVRRGDERECAGAIAGFLASHDTAVRLERLPAGAMATRIATMLINWGWALSQTPNGVCPIIQLAGHSWDSYLATLGSAHRANVRRRLRALEATFETRFDRVISEEQRREALDALIRFHAVRFGETSTAFVTPALRAFHDDATRRLLDRDTLRMYVLRLNDAPVAVMYGFLHNRRFYFYQHGFDDQYRQHSVGLALMALTVRAAIDEGADEFDMLWGTEPYKRLWARETRALHQIHLFPAHVGGRLQRHAVQARRRIGRFARRVIPRGGSSGT
jgi:CelD/BcsL family acetyltransferase involved in cellulose biosynthesis